MWRSILIALVFSVIVALPALAAKKKLLLFIATMGGKGGPQAVGFLQQEAGAGYILQENGDKIIITQ